MLSKHVNHWNHYIGLWSNQNRFIQTKQSYSNRVIETMAFKPKQSYSMNYSNQRRDQILVICMTCPSNIYSMTTYCTGESSASLDKASDKEWFLSKM